MQHHTTCYASESARSLVLLLLPSSIDNPMHSPPAALENQRLLLRQRRIFPKKGWKRFPYPRKYYGDCYLLPLPQVRASTLHRVGGDRVRKRRESRSVLHEGASGSFGCSSGSKSGVVAESRRVFRAFLFSRRIIFFFFLLLRFAVERERERRKVFFKQIELQKHLILVVRSQVKGLISWRRS